MSRPSPARRALRRQAIVMAGASILILGAATASEWLVAEAEAKRTAREVTTTVASAVVAVLEEQNLGEGVGDPSALDEELGPFFATGAVERVKIWRVEGERVRVIHSDEERSRGFERGFSTDLARRLDAGEVVVSSVPADSEHLFERIDGMWEGMVGFTDTAGTPLRLEVYVPVDTAAMVGTSLAVRLPLLGVIALALTVALVPLSVVLARRIRAVEDERRLAVSLGTRARRDERNDLARRLHDGIVQDLAAARLALETVLAGSKPGNPTIRRVIEVLEGDGRLLRGILDEFVSPAITASGLTQALEALAEHADPPVVVEVSAIDIDDEGAGVLFGAAQELVRNAVRHASASRITLAVSPDGDDAVLVVGDDGIGFDEVGAPGHVGLGLVRLAVTDRGGRVHVESSPGAGTRVEVRLPLVHSAPRGIVG